MTKVFSFLFLFISLWFGLASVFTHLIFIYRLDYSFYYIAWTSSLAFSLLIFLKPITSRRKLLRERFSKSTSWPHFVKLINGVAWALAFVLIPFFHKYYPFLLLAGLSMGNLSTFIFLKRYSKISNIEQLIAGSILLSSLFGILIYYSYFSDYETVLFSSRFLIALSYGLGGIIGYFRNTGEEVYDHQVSLD